MTHDLTGWFHAQWREQRRARAETMRCPVHHDVHGPLDACAYEDTGAYLDDDERYKRSRDV